MKLPDALEQAVRALLAPNGSSRHEARAAATESDDERTETGPGPVALRIEEATAEPLPAASPVEPQAEHTARERDQALVELERAAAVVERLGLGFHLGSAVERIAVASDEGTEGAQRLREAAWLIERYLELLERRPVGADLHVTMMRLAREGDTIAGLQALAAALERTPAAPAQDEPKEAAASGEAGPPAESAPTEHVILVPQPSIGRELVLVLVRALVVVAAIVGIVLALTLIAQLY
jgi:hypothetical protein